MTSPWETKTITVSGFEQKKLAKPFTAKLSDDTEGVFSGDGMVFDSEHPTSSWQLGPEWKDRVRPGAFSKSLKEHKAAGTMPLMLYMHERGNIPGVWKSIEESKEGLHLSGQVSKNAVTPSGVPLLELMKMGAITGLSIGFRATKVKLDEESKLRDILEVELGEISVVDIPGSPVSRITDVKKDLRGLEAVLRQVGLSRREAKALLADGVKGLGEELGGGVPGVDTPTLKRRAIAATRHADTLSRVARSATKDASNYADPKNMDAAHKAQIEASTAHRQAAAAHRDAGNSATADHHEKVEKMHGAEASAELASLAAHKASKKAEGSKDSKDHDANARAQDKAAQAHRDAAKLADEAGQKDVASLHDKAVISHEDQARSAERESDEAADDRDVADEDGNVDDDGGSNPDDIPRDDHGRFANKADPIELEELSTSVVQSINALRDAVANPTEQRDADLRTELKKFAQFLKSHLPQE